MEPMDHYLTPEEVASLWNISPRRVQALCATGKIPGVVRMGRDWMIPRDTPRPPDGRTKAGRQRSETNPDLPFPRKTPFLYMTDLYSVPGSAAHVTERLRENHEAQVLFAAEMAYARGEIDVAYESASYLLKKHSGFYAVLSAGMLLALCAIWKGDLTLWRQAKVHMVEIPMKTDLEREIVSFSLTAIDSMLYDVTNFPDWFQVGCFEPLHRDSLPAAKVYYAKYLYASAYDVATRKQTMEGVRGLSLMSMLPLAMEPMISQAMADNSVICEIYLRMTCATVYHTCDSDDRAIRHIDRALVLALPDQLYGILTEYRRVLGQLLDQRLEALDPEIAKLVKNLHKQYNEGWSRLSGSVRGKNLITTLSQKEREVAKLASFGMQNSEIAKKLHMSLSGVKQAIRIVSEKSGVSRDEFAAIL